MAAHYPIFSFAKKNSSADAECEHPNEKMKQTETKKDQKKKYEQQCRKREFQTMNEMFF